MPKKPRTRVESRKAAATIPFMAGRSKKGRRPEEHRPPADPNVKECPSTLNWKLPPDVRNAVQRYWAAKLYRNLDAQNLTALVRDLLYAHLNEGGYFTAE